VEVTEVLEIVEVELLGGGEGDEDEVEEVEVDGGSLDDSEVLDIEEKDAEENETDLKIVKTKTKKKKKDERKVTNCVDVVDVIDDHGSSCARSIYYKPSVTGEVVGQENLLSTVQRSNRSISFLIRLM